MDRITSLKREILAQELLIKETTSDLQENRKKLAELEKETPPICTKDFWEGLEQLQHKSQFPTK